MMHRILIGLLWGVPGYVIGAAAGGFLVSRLSSNRHDRSVEAATTGLLLIGPLVAIIAFVVGFMRSR
jgi:hypothetical protein